VIGLLGHDNVLTTFLFSIFHLLKVSNYCSLFCVLCYGENALYLFQVANGVEALKACVTKLKEHKRDLFALGDAEYIFLQFSFKKVSLQRQTTRM